MRNQRIAIGFLEFYDVCPSSVGRYGVDSVEIDDIALVGAEKHFLRQARFNFGKCVAGDEAPAARGVNDARTILALNEQNVRKIQETQPVAMLEHHAPACI